LPKNIFEVKNYIDILRKFKFRAIVLVSKEDEDSGHTKMLIDYFAGIAAQFGGSTYVKANKIGDFFNKPTEQ